MVPHIVRPPLRVFFVWIFLWRVGHAFEVFVCRLLMHESQHFSISGGIALGPFTTKIEVDHGAGSPALIFPCHCSVQIPMFLRNITSNQSCICSRRASKESENYSRWQSLCKSWRGESVKAGQQLFFRDRVIDGVETS